jgi:RNA polymerase sigma factor (sigma-70 family)
MKLNIGIIEDEQKIREGLTDLINAEEQFNCEFTFSNAESALEQIPSLNLDVVLVDIHLPGKNGIECVAALKPICQQTQFVMITSFEDSESVFRSLQAGATGYLTKNAAPNKILESILEVYHGGSPMSSHIARKIVSSFSKFVVNEELEKLSVREKEILELLSEGYRYKEIAEQLFVSTETVRTHIRNIYVKLQVNSRTEALNKVYKK